MIEALGILKNPIKIVGYHLGNVERVNLVEVLPDPFIVLNPENKQTARKQSYLRHKINFSEC